MFTNFRQRACVGLAFTTNGHPVIFGNVRHRADICQKVAPCAWGCPEIDVSTSGVNLPVLSCGGLCRNPLVHPSPSLIRKSGFMCEWCRCWLFPAHPLIPRPVRPARVLLM